ncbi:MAG: hypothetical protein AAB335_03910, partial [candidate division NC10 bacterium]
MTRTKRIYFPSSIPMRPSRIARAQAPPEAPDSQHEPREQCRRGERRQLGHPLERGARQPD